jgi:hypothetical protein
VLHLWQILRSCGICYCVFFTYGDRLQILAKAQQLYEGGVPNFDSCRSTVELRPVFNATRDGFADGVVAATLIVQVRDTLGYQGIETLQIQLDATDAEDLITELKRLQVKIRVVFTLMLTV